MEIGVIIGALSGLALGAALAWFVLKGRMDPIKESLNKELNKNEGLMDDKIELEKEVSRLKAELDAEKRSADEIKANMDEAREALKTEFQNVANKIFDEKREKFIDQNKMSLGGLIDPLKDKITEFEKKVSDLYDKEGKERHSLADQVKGLQDLNKRLSEDAENLTKALKGDTQKQGAWGELILERVLEESGLQKGREYFTQGGFRNDDNRLQKPDVIVQLPDQKDVVIDSKVSLVAYEQYVKAETQEEREIAAKAHLTSINGHLKGLSEKSYDELPELRSLDFVLMFIPIESAFILAIESEADIFSKAFQQKIMIVSPTTLLITLRTIQNIWRYEHQTKNAQEIARQAGGLYDKFAGFVGDLEEIGKHINRTHGAYEAAHNKLSEGKGNLIGRAQKLKELGVKTKKSIQAGDAVEEVLLDEDLEEAATTE
jgi:DNA recombination protein RmuC